MRRLALFLCALAGAVLVQAFIRMVVAPGRRTATAGRDESGQEIGDWENEGGSLAVSSLGAGSLGAGSLAVSSRRDSEGGAG
jgi:hypothetical protein